jgi:hypothetical protein
MAIEAKKREGEAGSALLYTFTRKVKRSGILKRSPQTEILCTSFKPH